MTTYKFINFFFSGTDGKFEYGYPTGDEIQYYNNPEPCHSSLQLLGMDKNLQRPHIPSGIFSNLNVYSIGFTDDVYMYQEDIQNIHLWVTESECTEDTCFFLDAPHDGMITAYDSITPIFESILY
jgi:hypothetical protein